MNVLNGRELDAACARAMGWKPPDLTQDGWWADEIPAYSTAPDLIQAMLGHLCTAVREVIAIEVGAVVHVRVKANPIQWHYGDTIQQALARLVVEVAAKEKQHDQ